MRRVNLLRAHGSPGRSLYTHHGCRCAACRGATSADGAAYRALHRDERRDRKYNLLPGEWDAMLAAQDNRCAVCMTTKPGGRDGQWQTDHDHATSKVRGILCHHCNTGIGHFRDDPRFLTAASEYLAMTSQLSEDALRV